MKTLSLLQPWASLVALGEKRVETRSWSAPRSAIGQPLAIHASKTFAPKQVALCAQEPFARALQRHGLEPADLPLGQVIATCTLAACVPTEAALLDRNLSDQERAFGNYGDGRYAWYLDDAEAIAPVPARGSLGLWEWEPLPAAEEAEPLHRAYGRDLVVDGETISYMAHAAQSALPFVEEFVRAAYRHAREGRPPAAATRVVHVNRDPFDIYIGRSMRNRPDLVATGWGNPFFPPGAIERYREWLQAHPKLLARLPELRGKTLGCWCAPKGGLPGNLDGRVCHGEVLAALADAAVPLEVAP